MFWLITYTQKGTEGNLLTANEAVCASSPADWLIDTIRKLPNAGTVLLFSSEITEEQYNDLIDMI